MGVGYSASALHWISYLEPIAGAKEQQPPSDPVTTTLLKMRGTVWDGRPREFRSPSVGSIIQWRTELAAKYQTQLEEDLLWDEQSSFEESEDVATSADMLLRYVAAVLDQHGAAAPRILPGTVQPSHSELEQVFAEANRRGFGGRFPQLMLGARYWLPFQRHLMIEEPNWFGSVERYGSLFRLADEIDDVRTFIAAADPSATKWTANRVTAPEDILSAAWQASDTVSRLAAVAAARHVPLWTTG